MHFELVECGCGGGLEGAAGQWGGWGGGGGADWLLSRLGLISSGENEPRHRAQSRSRLQMLLDFSGFGPFLVLIIKTGSLF